MNPSLQRKEPGFAWMMLCSTAIHLTCYYLLVAFHFSALPFNEGPVYYVDIVNLPVANPRAGSPSSSPAGAPPASSREEMALPEKTSPKTDASATKAAAQKESEEQFQKRLSQVKKHAEEKEFSNALASLGKRAAAQSGQSGVPGGKGTEAGSDYAGYIRSRLMDAFRTTIAYQSKNPEAMVRLTIDKNGRVIGLRFERKTGDRIFEDSVQRAILKAEQNFPPPPDGGRFEFSYRFAPEGVSKK